MNTTKTFTLSERHNFNLNLLNLALFLITALTGAILQFKYHMHGLPVGWPVMGLTKTGWALLHKVSSTLFLAGIIAHCALKWRFISTLTRRIRNRGKSPFASLSYDLFLICIPTCLTALAAWLLFGPSTPTRFIFIETHDKLGLVLIIVTVLHIVSRTARMARVYRKLVQERVG